MDRLCLESQLRLVKDSHINAIKEDGLFSAVLSNRLHLETIQPVFALLEREDIFTPHNERVKTSEKERIVVLLKEIAYKGFHRI